jgi:hypothetical protein
VQWYRQFQNRRIVYDDEEGFELTLNVNSSLNGSQHFCVVTVNHDGSQTNIRNYSGGIITVVAVNLMDTQVQVSHNFIIHIVLGTVTGLCLIGFMVWAIVKLCGKFRIRTRSANGTQSVPVYFHHLHTFNVRNPVEGDYLREYGIKLRIPEGAIPNEKRGFIDIAIAFNGPFEYPQGFRPVSPVFWICFRGHLQDQQFQEPLNITMQHCLSVYDESSVKSSGLTFLKADHSLSDSLRYQFNVLTDSKQDFSVDYTGALSTKHLCCICICCKCNPTTANRIKYSLIREDIQCLQSSGSNSEPFKSIDMYVMLSLPYCQKIVAGQKYEKGVQIMHRDFHFKQRSNEHQPQGLTLKISPGEKISGCHFLYNVQADSLQFSFDRGVSGV